MIITRLRSLNMSLNFTAVSVLLLSCLIVINYKYSGKSIQTDELPYDKNNPVIYDNDDYRDVYTDEYLMALAHAGEIDLVGILTSSSIAPFNRHVKPKLYEQCVVGRAKIVEHARSSRFRNIPHPLPGAKGHLVKPISGVIEDTKPLNSPGGRFIVNEANKAMIDKPIVIIMGGPLTVMADAYLLDPTIAKKIIVAWLGGTVNDMGGYNGWADNWAAYIILQRCTLIQFSGVNYYDIAPTIPKSELMDLNDSKLLQWMIEKHHPENSLPDEHDLDSPPAIALMRANDYVLRSKKVSFSHFKMDFGRPIPVFKEDTNGTAIVITRADKKIATEEWWRALKNLLDNNE